MIRVVIAEDHLMVRAGIRALLEKARNIRVLGEAANGHEAIELTRNLNPDVLIMDIMMPRLNGIQAAAYLHEQAVPTRVVLLSMYADEGFVHQALQCGVKGYVLKSSVSDELIRAIRAVVKGQTYLSDPISDLTTNLRAAGQPIDVLSTLSPREKEVLQLIAEEYTSGQIASMLGISEKTVEKHRTRLMEKLKTRNIVGLVRLAIKYRLVDPDI